MSIKGALAGLNKIKEKAAAKQGSDFSGESPFLTIKDGEKVTIRFIQEFEENDLYDARRGTVEVVEEHVSPKNFRLRAVCTYETDGRCWACEQVSLPEVGKKWKSKMRMYANVIVRAKDADEDKVKVYATGFGKTSTGTMLIEMAEELEALGACDMKLSRKGSGMNDTSYTLLPLPPKAMSKKDKDQEVLDLSKFIKYVDYDHQAEFYNGSDSEATKEEW